MQNMVSAINGLTCAEWSSSEYPSLQNQARKPGLDLLRSKTGDRILKEGIKSHLRRNFDHIGVAAQELQR
jgi:hypothetical protein